MSHFFALMSRLKYIDRWALMRSLRDENLAEHSLEVAMIAHALCVIGNVRYGRHLDADRAALIGLYHDASEIITGDMPTPVKYRNGMLRDAYHDVEAEAQDQLLQTLPADLRPDFEQVFHRGSGKEEAYLWQLVKAADKLSALIKCMEELSSGSGDFAMAQASTRAKLDQMAQTLPELTDFMNEFLPSYGRTLDELL